MSEVMLVYDKECPLCHYYCLKVRIEAAVGELVLVDARKPSCIIDEVSALGWDIDQGMVLKVGQFLYYGADAIHVLSLLGSRSGVFNRINFWLFRNKAVSVILYPLMRSLRNLLLKMLGVTKINNLGLPEHEKF